MRADNQIPVACFAVPLTDERLAKYRDLVAGLETSAVKDAMAECLKAVELWWELPESTRPKDRPFAIRHEGKDHEFAVTPLEGEQVKALWDAVPWPYELQAMGALFETIDPVAGKELRDAAHDLLWICVELSLDREPLTADKL